MSGFISLIVYGVERSCSIEQLRRIFEEYGMVTDVYISEMEGGHARVKMIDRTEAETAFQAMNGTIINGRKIRIVIEHGQDGGGCENHFQSFGHTRQGPVPGPKFPTDCYLRSLSEIVL